MKGLLRDIRYSVRSLRKRRAFSMLVVLVLALAIAGRALTPDDDNPKASLQLKAEDDLGGISNRLRDLYPVALRYE